MSARFVMRYLVLLGTIVLLAAACQPIQPEAAGEAAGNPLEAARAEAIAQEVATGPYLVNQDWEAYEAVTAPDFFQVGVDGGYIERDAAMAGLKDELFQTRGLELGEIRALMVAPDAIVVTYPMTFHGTYDGSDFSNPRTLVSIWANREGTWQNIFLAENDRTVPLDDVMFAADSPLPATAPEDGVIPDEAALEAARDEAVMHELGAFDLYIDKDWETLETEIGQEYYGISIDGGYVERDASMAGLIDEKLQVLPPDLGEIRTVMLTPNAFLVVYPLNFNGTYDGAEFSNPRTVASLWVKRDGAWQNVFLWEGNRTVPF